MAAMCVAFAWQEQQAHKARLVSSGALLADIVGASNLASLSFDDGQDALRTLRAVSVDQSVLTAAVLRADGTTLARYDRNPAVTGVREPRVDREGVRRGRSWHEFVDSGLSVSRPIVVDGDVIGASYLELSADDLAERLGSLRRSLIAALLGAVALSILIAGRLQRLVSVPLARLIGATHAVTSRNDYGIRVPVDTEDEVGAIGKAFNVMLDGIQVRDVAIDYHRGELERTVEARTVELQASVERIRLLVEGTHAVPWEIDGSSRVFSYVAPQVSHLFGFDSADLVNRRPIDDLIVADDRDRVVGELTALASNLEDGGLSLDYRGRTANGEDRDIRTLVTAHPQSDGRSGAVLRGISMDITDQRRLELDLRQAQKLESVGRLASGVAHEINTPIQFVSDSVSYVREAVRELVDLIRQYQAFQRAVDEGASTHEASVRMAAAVESADLDYAVEQIPKALDRSVDGLSRVATIVRSMKEFAHPDQKDMMLTDLNRAIESTLTIARHEYKYVADVRLDLGDIPPITCHGGEINQVVLNLVVNAAHAIGDRVGATEARGEISISTRGDGAGVVIAIGDTGGGIPEEIRERVFDPFFTTKGVGKGTGQGLAIARSVIVEKHGGTLTFESEMGEGTTFFIRLPQSGRASSAA
jgi:PAS domain S-box-containing protein